MPNSGNSSDFQMISLILCIDQHDLLRSTGHIDESVAVMGDTGNAADVAGRAADVDVGGHIFDGDVAFPHEADDTTDITPVILGFRFHITARSHINRQAGQVGIGVFAEHAADIGVALYFHRAGEGDIGIF